MRKILHWLACHTVILVFLGFVVVAISFRAQLFGITEPLVTLPGAEKSDQPAQMLQPDVQDSAIQTEKPAIAAMPEKVGQQLPQESNAENIISEVETLPVKTEDQPSAPTPSLTTSIDSPKQEKKPQDDEGFVFKPDAQPQAVDTKAPAAADLLQQARKAFWNEQINKARSLYQAVIDEDPMNPDGYGEYGNLLSTIGELDEAAGMYEIAADLLKEQGKFDQAGQLEEVLKSIRVIKAARN